jgi:hypothetical protein
VDGVHALQRRVLLTLTGWTIRTLDGVTLTQVVAAHGVDRNIDVTVAGLIAVDAQEAVAVVAQIQDAFDVHEFAGIGLVTAVTLGLTVETIVTATVTTTVPSTTVIRVKVTTVTAITAVVAIIAISAVVAALTLALAVALWGATLSRLSGLT